MYMHVYLTIVISDFLNTGEALPQTVAVSNGNSSCTSGQVTNIIIHGGGVTGTQGERTYTYTT